MQQLLLQRQATGKHLTDPRRRRASPALLINGYECLSKCTVGNTSNACSAYLTFVRESRRAAGIDANKRAFLTFLTRVMQQRHVSVIGRPSTLSPPALAQGAERRADKMPHTTTIQGRSAVC